MEFLCRATQLPNAILDHNENVLVAAGWSDICTKFHRCHPITEARCSESDAFIKAHVIEKEYVEYS